MYDMKALYEAYSVEEAVKLRLEHPEAQIIAGGTDVLVQMREGRRAGKELISIQKIDSMRGVCMDENENIRIGSLTTFSHITHNPIIIEKINVLGEAVDMVGGPQIRNAGTIGGNTCNGVTSADSASTLHAWEAIVELTGVNGKRYLPIKDFYIKAGTVDINVAEGEIQTAILIPKASWENTKGFYIKYGMRNAMEIATTGCSVNVRLSADKKTFDRVRIAYESLSNGTGDCYAYDSVAIAFLSRLGVEYKEIQRTPGLTSDTHYWLLVNIGTKTSPRWYHYDCTRLRAEYNHSGCLLTDKQVRAYSKVRANFYAYDTGKYPASSTEIITRTPELEPYYS